MPEDDPCATATQQRVALSHEWVDGVLQVCDKFRDIAERGDVDAEECKFLAGSLRSLADTAYQMEQTF